VTAGQGNQQSKTINMKDQNLRIGHLGGKRKLEKLMREHQSEAIIPDEGKGGQYESNACIINKIK